MAEELNEPVGSCLRVAGLAAVGKGYGLPPATFGRLWTRRLSGRGVALRAGQWRSLLVGRGVGGAFERL